MGEETDPCTNVERWEKVWACALAGESRINMTTPWALRQRKDRAPLGGVKRCLQSSDIFRKKLLNHTMLQCACFFSINMGRGSKNAKTYQVWIFGIVATTTSLVIVHRGGASNC